MEYLSKVLIVVFIKLPHPVERVYRKGLQHNVAVQRLQTGVATAQARISNPLQQRR